MKNMTRSVRFAALGVAAMLAAGIVATSYAGDSKPAALADDDKPGPESFEGKAAPEISLTPLAGGKPVTLASLKGKVVVLDYWATWCPPCRASLPHLNELSQDKSLSGKGLVVYAVNDKEQAPKVKDFVAKNNLKFNVLMDPKGALGTSYLVSGIPTTIVVGRDGKVAKAFVGFSEDESPKALKETVEKALAADAPAKAD